MGVFAWILGGARWSKKRRPKANRWDRVSLAPNLRVRRLEERRVLNADAAPVQALVVNAGAAAGDGHADTFVVEQHDNQVRVSINGKEVSNTPISQISTIKIQGSSDDDILIAEFKSGEPLAGFNLMFDGKGGKDALVLNSNAPVNSVAYNLGASSGDHVDIKSGSDAAEIGFTNVESVNDSLTAQSRSFNIQSGGEQLTISDAGTANDARSQIEINNPLNGTRELIVFKNPTSEFSLKTDASTDKADTVTLNGFDHNYQANTHVVGSSDDLLIVHGPTDLSTGNLDVNTGTVRVESSLTTSHANLDIHATNEFLLTGAGALHNDAGNIRVDAPTIEQDGAIVAHGGLVHLDSGTAGTTSVRGTIDVSQSDPTKTAGTIHVLGSQVGLFDNAQIDASAVVGAGTVLIGGDYQGKNSVIQNALRTYIGSNAVIRADAIERGSGGKIIVWADEVSLVYGNLSVRGGVLAGDGGFVETSGKGYLDFQGTVNATAFRGEAGTWLLDPIDITITAVPVPPVLAPDLSVAGLANFTAAVTSSINVAVLNAQLGLVNVLVAADNIDVQAPILSVVAGKKLTLQATDAIDVNALISTAGDIVLNAGGAIDINAAISSTAGSISITGSTIDQNANITTGGAGNVNVTATAGGGDITMAAGAITTTATGAITYTAGDNVDISLLTSTSGAVNVTSLAGFIDETNNAANDIVTTGPVLLSAAQRIGSGATLELGGVTNLTLATDGNFHVNTDVALTDLTVTVDPSGGGHTYELADNGNLIFNVTDGGSNLTVTEVSVATGNLDFKLTSNAGDIDLSVVSVGNGTASLAATAGSIDDDNAAANNVTAQDLALRASDGIATNANALETSVTKLAFNNTTTGDVHIVNDKNLTLMAVDGLTSSSNADPAPSGGLITIEANGQLTIGMNVADTAGGIITLAAAGAAAGHDLHIDASVAASGGNANILLFAGDTIQVGATGVVSAAGAGDIILRAGTDFNAGSPLNGIGTGNLTMAAGGQILSEDGDISLLAPGNVALGLVNANGDADAASGNVVITADFDGVGSGLSDNVGAITDNTLLETANIITGGTATLTAATGIGGIGAADIDTSIDSLVATNSTSGDIVVQETNGLIVAGTGVRTLGGNGNIDIDVTNGPLTINQPVTANGAGKVTLNAANGTVTIGGVISSTSGAIAVTGNVITQNANISTGLAGTIDVMADAGNITMADGTNSTSLAGAITYKASGNVALSLLQSTGSAAINVSADTDSAGGGSIIDNTAAEAANLVTTGAATLTAATGIGGAAGADIDTTIGTLAATNIASGDIVIQETNTLVVGGAGVQSAGNVSIDVVAGPLTVGTGAGEDITATGARVVLNAAGGVTELAGSTIVSNELLLTGAGPFALPEANNVNTLAAAVNGAVTFTDANTLTLGTVLGTAGINSIGNNVTLNTGGTLTIGNGAGEDIIATAARVVLNPTTGGVTELAGSTVLSNELLLTGAGTFLLDQANDVNTVAAGINGDLTLVDIDDLTVGTVLATAGIATAGHDVRLQASVLDITGSTVDTNDLADGTITFVVEVELKSAGTVDAGTASLQIFPDSTSRVIEFAATNSPAVPNDAFYASGFTSLTAGLVVIGRSTQAGNIHIGNDLAPLAFAHNLQVQNSGTGRILLESDYDSSVGNGNLTLLSGSGTTLGDLTANVPGTVDINLGGGAIAVTGNTTLADNANLFAGGGIVFNNNIDADDALLQDRILTLNSGTTGSILVSGAVGSAQPLAALTIAQSNGATFVGAVNVTDSPVGLVEIIDTVDTQTVSFQGNLSADSLVVNNGGADNYNVSITGSLNTIGGTTTFANGGLITIGNDATDVTTFVDGVVALAPADQGATRGVTIAGTIAATSGASSIRLGDADTSVRVTQNSTIGGAASGLIDLGDLTVSDGVLLQVGTGIDNPINLDAIDAATAGQANVRVQTLGTVTVAEAVGTLGALNALGQFSVVAGSMDLQGNVTATSLVDLAATNTIRLHNVDVKATNDSGVDAGVIKLNVPTLAGFDFQNVVFQTRNNGANGGQISQDAFKPTVLANSDVAATQTPLSQNNRTANVEVRVTDPGGTNFGVQVDWLEGPVLDPNARIQNGTGNAEPVFIPFTHVYNSNPTGNPVADIPMVVRLVTFANDTIQPTVGGVPLVFEKTVVIDVLTLPTLVPTVVVEPLAVEAPVPPPVQVRAEVAQAVEAPPQQFLPITGGVTSAGEERFYELRVVTFDKDGMPVEAREARIRLDDPRLKAINPFNPKLNRTEKFNLSKLPILFGRLPADHYRIYLIEDHTERLILDFTIQQGQPIEIRESESSTSEINKDATNPFGDEAAPPAPDANQNNGQRPAEQVPLKNGATNNHRYQAEPMPAASDSKVRSKMTTSADAFAEQLGRASFVSHGGIVVGAAAFAFARRGDWEQSVDRLMERFDRRRSSPRPRQDREHHVAPPEACSSNSTHHSL